MVKSENVGRENGLTIGDRGNFPAAGGMICSGEILFKIGLKGNIGKS